MVRDVGYLARLQHRVDRHEGSAGRRGTENARYRLGLLGQVDADPFAGSDAAAHEPVGESTNERVQLTVGKDLIFVKQRRCIGLLFCLRPD